MNSLAEVGAEIAREKAEHEAALSAALERKRIRDQQTTEALIEIRKTIDKMYYRICQCSELIERKGDKISLGGAELNVETPQPCGIVFETPWDVLVTITISVGGPMVIQPRSHNDFYTHSATLMFSTAKDDASYRWRETSFFNPFEGLDLYPLGASATHNFRIALSSTRTKYEFAYGPWTIDGEDEEAFIERWIGMFAKAASRKLSAPRSLPIPISYFTD